MKEYKKVYTERSGAELIVGRLDVRFERRKGKVLDFALSLKYVKGEEEYEVYRVDTAPSPTNTCCGEARRRIGLGQLREGNGRTTISC